MSSKKRERSQSPARSLSRSRSRSRSPEVSPPEPESYESEAPKRRLDERESQQEPQDESVETDNNGERKRARLDHSSSPSASPAAPDFRLLINNSQVGPIMGHGAANITALRQSTKAVISVLKQQGTAALPPNAERIVEIKGTHDQVRPAAENVVQTLLSHPSAGDSECHIRVLVHRGRTGAIIGHGGERIKSLTAETKCKIKIAQECVGQSTEKIVTLSGSSDAVLQAFQRVYAALETAELKPGSSNILYVPNSAPPLPPVGYPGASLYPPYAPHSQPFAANNMQHAAPARNSSYDRPPRAAHDREHDSYDRQSRERYSSSSTPSPSSAYASYQGGYPPFSPYYPPYNGASSYPPSSSSAYGSYPPSASSYYGDSRRVGDAPYPPRSSRDPASTAPQATQKISIPTVTVGCVIGKGGSIINDLRARSQCNISIADADASTPDERIVTVTGPHDAIQRAIGMIQQCVESYQPATRDRDREQQTDSKPRH